MRASNLGAALVDELDDCALERLAELLAPLLVGRLSETTPDEDRWMTSREAANYLGTTLSTIWKLTAALEIPFSQDKPGAKTWFKRSQLDAWREGAWKR
jgi:excisionase family DNA binding protein